ncbi:MAG: bifunctional DNA primase/polymerase, partial [Nocardiopsaceae bacterium]|nr:bifunctional DNA primase/polymerase [Nocardiopsaceae bacterium]
ARMAAAGAEPGPVAASGTDRILFYVATRGAPADEDEWWSCGLDASPGFSEQATALRWHCRDSYVLAPPSRLGDSHDVRWMRPPAGRPLPDALRLLEYLVDACEETHE